ncbi:MAG: Rap1a/Tai family immunity protein [Burkholderiales bacterium]
MRIAVLAATAVFAAPVYAVPPDYYKAHTTAELVAVCSAPTTQADYATAIAFCHGVLAGAYGFYVSATPVAERNICAPDPAPTRSQVATGFIAWTKNNPQYLKDGAIDTLFRYAAEAFPCKKR